MVPLAWPLGRSNTSRKGATRAKLHICVAEFEILRCAGAFRFVNPGQTLAAIARFGWRRLPALHALPHRHVDPIIRFRHKSKARE